MFDAARLHQVFVAVVVAAACGAGAFPAIATAGMLAPPAKTAPGGKTMSISDPASMPGGAGRALAPHELMGLYRRRDQTMQIAHQLGATHIRIWAYRHFLDSCVPGVSDQNRQLLHDSVAIARANNLVPVVSYVAVRRKSWGGHGCTGRFLYGYNPDPADYAAWVRRETEPLVDRGVRVFSTFNEPDHPGFLCAPRPHKGPDGKRYIPPDPEVEGEDPDTLTDQQKRTRQKWCSETRGMRIYRKLHSKSYRAIKSVGKAKGQTVYVMFGEVTAGAGSWTQDLLRAGRLEGDIFALHPYQPYKPKAGGPNQPSGTRSKQCWTQKVNWVAGASAGKPIKQATRHRIGVSCIDRLVTIMNNAHRHRAKKGGPGVGSVPLNKMPIWVSEYGIHVSDRSVNSTTPEWKQDPSGNWYKVDHPVSPNFDGLIKRAPTPLPEAVRGIWAAEAFDIMFDHPRVHQMLWYTAGYQNHPWEMWLQDAAGNPTPALDSVRGYLRSRDFAAALKAVAYAVNAYDGHDQWVYCWTPEELIRVPKPEPWTPSAAPAKLQEGCDLA